MPLGVPLAGYNYAPRAGPFWPIPSPGEYTTWMEPSQGLWNPTWIKALVLDNGEDTVAFVTMDAVGADSQLSRMAWELATVAGFKIPYEKCTFSASHTHSGVCS